MKNSIQREQLKQIHDVACDTWKNKIVEYGAKDPFSESIKFTDKQIEEMISACTKEQLPILKGIFEIKNNWEDIKTVEDACKLLGEIDSEVRELRLLQNIPNLSRKTLSAQELAVITKALNGGWVVDFDDPNQHKYVLWWYLGKNFRLEGVYCFNTYSIVPARLCNRSKEIADYSSSQFFDIWKDYMN